MTNKRKTLLLAGGSGFLGSEIGERFSQLGWNIRLLTRNIRPHQMSFPCKQIKWNGLFLKEDSLREIDAVINLSGVGIFDKSWSKSYQNKILNSRLLSSRAIVNAIKASERKPSVVLQASAVGYFGQEDRYEKCYEDSKPGKDFIANICHKWEHEIEQIDRSVRVCTVRLGVVLGWSGGAFPKLWDIYSSGVGSVLGNGKQWMNWVHLEDVLNFFSSAISKKNTLVLII